MGKHTFFGFALRAILLLLLMLKLTGCTTVRVIALSNWEIAALDANDIVRIMQRVGFSREQIIEHGTELRNSLARNGAAQIRVGKITEAIFAIHKPYVHVSSRLGGSFIYNIETGKAFDESREAKTGAEKAINNSAAALQAAVEAKKDAVQAATIVREGMQMEVTAIQGRLEDIDKKLKSLDETARIAREESSLAKAASAEALHKTARSTVQPETFSDPSLKQNISGLSERTEVLSEAIITNFGRRKWELDPLGCKKLDKLCSEIAGMDYSIITVTGFADPSGSKKNNFLLGRKRAESVKEYLIKKGLDKDRIMASSLGDTVVFVSNETEEGRRQNRRVEIRAWR